MAIPVRWVCTKCSAIGEAIADYGDDAAFSAALSHSRVSPACDEEWGAGEIRFAQREPYPD